MLAELGLPERVAMHMVQFPYRDPPVDERIRKLRTRLPETSLEQVCGPQEGAKS